MRHTKYGKPEKDEKLTPYAINIGLEDSKNIIKKWIVHVPERVIRDKLELRYIMDIMSDVNALLYREE